MKTRILALAVLNVLAAFAVASAGGQAQWDERAVQGGVEFWLLNDEGTAIVLRCADQEVHAAFVFTEPMEAARGALVIGQLADVEPGRILPPAALAAQLPGRSGQRLDRPDRQWSRARLHVGHAGRRGEHPRAHGWSARVFRGGGQRLDAGASPASGRETPYRLRNIGLRQVGGGARRCWESARAARARNTMKTLRRLNR